MTVDLWKAGPLPRPGFYPGLAEARYHADPVPGGSLSSSAAAKLLPPNTPAEFRHYLDNGLGPSPSLERRLDFGSAAHLFTLGVGPPIDRLPFDSWRTNAVKDAAEASRGAGRIPVLERDHDVLTAMSAQLKAHPIAGRMLNPAAGTGEVTAWAVDPDTGVNLRVRLDWLPNRPAGGRPLYWPDYKTTDRGVDPWTIGKLLHDLSYGFRVVFYEHVLRLLGVESRGVIVAQSTKRPYLVSVTNLPDDYRDVMARLVPRVISRYAQLAADNQWPGWDTVQTAVVPPWAYTSAEEAEHDLADQ